MKKLVSLFTFVLLLYGVTFCQNNKKTIDLTPKLEKMTLVDGRNVVEKLSNGYQLVIDKDKETKVWKMINPAGAETVLTPVPTTNTAKKNSANSINKKLNGPVLCEICYTYPDGMQICREVPCP